MSVSSWPSNDLGDSWGKHGSNGWEWRLSPNQGFSGGTTQQDPCTTVHHKMVHCLPILNASGHTDIAIQLPFGLSVSYHLTNFVWNFSWTANQIIQNPSASPKLCQNPEAINVKRISWVKDCCIESVPTPRAWLSQRKASKGDIVTLAQVVFKPTTK